MPTIVPGSISRAGGNTGVEDATCGEEVATVICGEDVASATIWSELMAVIVCGSGREMGMVRVARGGVGSRESGPPVGGVELAGEEMMRALEETGRRGVGDAEEIIEVEEAGEELAVRG